MKRVSASDQACDDELAACILASLSGQVEVPSCALDAFNVCQESLESLEPAKKSARHSHAAAKQANSSPRCQVAPTRSYTWRGPHRLALKQKQEAAKLLQEQACSSDADRSSRRSSASSGHSDGDDAAPQQQHQQQLDASPAAEPSSRQRDKEWAALTTWLRMNLSNPRTVKKLVLFVGEQDAATGSWRFSLNPGLSWADLSLETKLRLKMLPLEAEQAFQHKYPHRPPHEWRSKAQKYRPPGAAAPVDVALSDMVLSLNSIYFKHEAAAAAGSSSQPAPTQPQLQPQHPASCCVLAPAAATGSSPAGQPNAAEGPVSPHQAAAAPVAPAIQAC